MARIGGSVKPGDASAGEIFASRLAEVRKARGWTQTQLADRIKELGGVGLTGRKIHRVRLAKIESDPEKAARVTLEEALAISYALDVSPLYMIAPVKLNGPRLAIMGSVQPADPGDARSWLRGETELIGQDPFVFAVERPNAEVPKALENKPHLIQRWRQGFQYGKEKK